MDPALAIKLVCLFYPLRYLANYSIFLDSLRPDWCQTHYGAKEELLVSCLTPRVQGLQVCATTPSSDGARDGTRGFSHTRKALYQCCYIHSTSKLCCLS